MVGERDVLLDGRTRERSGGHCKGCGFLKPLELELFSQSMVASGSHRHWLGGWVGRREVGRKRRRGERRKEKLRERRKEEGQQLTSCSDGTDGKLSNVYCALQEKARDKGGRGEREREGGEGGRGGREREREREGREGGREGGEGGREGGKGGEQLTYIWCSQCQEHLLHQNW